MWFLRGEIWLTYYSSHEGKAAIYLARLKADHELRSPVRQLRQLELAWMATDLLCRWSDRLTHA
jgi:hypothetical protein